MLAAAGWDLCYSLATYFANIKSLTSPLLFENLTHKISQLRFKEHAS